MSSSLPVFSMDNVTHWANLMIKYIVARKIKRGFPELVLSNFSMPYWNIQHEFIPPSDGDKIYLINHEQIVDIERVVYLGKSRAYDRFSWIGYGQRMEYLLEKDECRMMFQNLDVPGIGTGDDVVLCPIRGGEVLDAVHPGYTVIPVQFYVEQVERLGKRPVFTGQIDDNIYMREIRRAFPNAEYLRTSGILEDFQTIRRAKNIILPVSTFA
nr:hypothetical protein [uncultured Rhizobium sp.]